MKVLVTGVRGQLGHDVCKRLSEIGIAHQGVDIQDFDLTDPAQTSAAVAACQPDAVIHCAAYTAVEKAESQPELCARVNGEGTLNVARACREGNAKMIYISTDYVFNGQGETPFAINDPITPQNVYGLTKYQGEVAVYTLLKQYFIVRTSWVFGVNGGNFVKTMLRLGREKDSLPVVCDQVGSPTYTADLARLLCDMVQTDRYGVYHATNEGECSWYQFAQAIMAAAQLPCQVTPVLTKDYKTGVKRPLNSRLSKRSLDDAGFRRLPPWQDALDRYLAELRAWE